MTAKIEPIIVIIDDQVYRLGGYWAGVIRRQIEQRMRSNAANEKTPPAETVEEPAGGHVSELLGPEN